MANLGIDFHSGVPDVTSLSRDIQWVLCDTFHTSFAQVRQDVLKAGLLFGCYQGYDTASWSNLENAYSRARLAVSACQSAGVTEGSVIFLDCEQSQFAMEEWVTTWGKTVAEAGYQPGAYLGAGFNCDWAKVTDIAVYWKSVSLSSVPNLINGNPYHIYQVTDSTNYAGISVDFDVEAMDGVNWDNGIVLPTRSASSTPIPASSASSASGASNASSASSASSTHTITVQKGQTLWGLTKGNWSLIHEIQSLNHMGSSTTIDAGASLIVPESVS